MIDTIICLYINFIPHIHRAHASREQHLYMIRERLGIDGREFSAKVEVIQGMGAVFTSVANSDILFGSVISSW